METKTPTTSQHQRAPRTPESYFNVPESIALLNIVKSERIQSAFQSNRKNHASVWEMVAEILNRFSTRKRSAKQCCNRYENLKKIYTQLKKNPEKHVRRNWPYMYLFKEIEDQRGETWGSNGKRLQLGAKEELSYYHRRRAAALNLLLVKEAAQQNGAGDDHPHNGKIERYMANSFVETQLNDYDDGEREKNFRPDYIRNGHTVNDSQHHDKKASSSDSTAVKHEPTSDNDFNPDDITLVPCDYNGSHNFYPHNIDPTLLHPDVIVDTDNISESSSRSSKSKRKTSTSTDGDSTNYELIEYLKRRERRDEEMFKRMEEREKRLLNLLERTVIAIECLAGTRNRFE
ncbi:uncharacterized protein LOC129908881 isoform X2 [Episyrphus balteatus]|uniref:uncharacterized protein LOC129908881 isoform X2 n=1 Tax=Episyrphus balteatus TaxID=286459 RepID=UPI002486302F|nr:uncharacterized protein LOC129908881 isoform X2 [Episyrphus balteatus]